MNVKIDDKIIVDGDAINNINSYYLQNKVKCNNLFIDIDKFLRPYPRLDLVQLLIDNSECDHIFAISNKGVASKLRLPLIDFTEECEDECEIIPEKHFFKIEDFILNVEKLNNVIKDKKITIGPGRGSAVNCQRFYDIGLTAIDPQKYNLHESRFVGFRKSKIDIDIDIDGDSRPILIKEFNKKNKVKLLQKLNSRQKPHNSGYHFVTKKDIANKFVILKKVDGKIYISKSNLPGVDLLSVSMLSRLKNTNWSSIVEESTDKPLLSDTFHIGQNKLAHELWKLGDSLSIEDISFIMAIIRPGAARQLETAGVPCGIEEVDSVIKDTNYCLIYQDQINSIISNIFNMNLYQSDTLRKKIIEVIPTIKKELLKKYDKPIVQRFLDVLQTVNRYLFCKGHSLAYSAIILSQLNHGLKDD